MQIVSVRTFILFLFVNLLLGLEVGHAAKCAKLADFVQLTINNTGDAAKSGEKAYQILMRVRQLEDTDQVKILGDNGGAQAVTIKNIDYENLRVTYVVDGKEGDVFKTIDDDFN